MSDPNQKLVCFVCGKGFVNFAGDAEADEINYVLRMDGATEAIKKDWDWIIRERANCFHNATLLEKK